MSRVRIPISNKYSRAHIKWQYNKEVMDVTPMMRKVLKANMKILIYAGDADMACNFMMGQKFSERLGLPVREIDRQINRQIDINCSC